MGVKQPTMECPNCKELEFRHVATHTHDGKISLQYECERCRETGFFDDLLPKTKTMAVAWVSPDDLLDTLTDIAGGIK